MQILHASNTRGFYFRILFPATFLRRFSHFWEKFAMILQDSDTATVIFQRDKTDNKTLVANSTNSEEFTFVVNLL